MIKKISIINVVLILSVFFLLDYMTFYFQKKLCINYVFNYFENMIQINVSQENKKNFFRKRLKRQPIIVKEADNKAVVFMGCSFTYGAGLNENETVSAQVSKYLNENIYNLGINGGSLNKALFLVKSGLFKEEVKEKPAVVTYIYGDFHIERFLTSNILYSEPKILYKNRGNKLIEEEAKFTLNFPLIYIIRNTIHYKLSVTNKYYRSYLKKLLRLHFLAIKEELEKQYGDFTFIILEYQPSNILDEIKDTLINDGFVIKSIFLDVDTGAEENVLPDGHPSANVWKKSAPILAEEIKKYL